MENRLPGMKRPLKQIPVFRQQPGESQKRFFNRMERTAKAVIERSRYEDKYGVEVTQDEVTGQTSVRDREKDEVELAKEQARNSLIELDLGQCWHFFFAFSAKGASI